MSSLHYLDTSLVTKGLFGLYWDCIHFLYSFSILESCIHFFCLHLFFCLVSFSTLSSLHFFFLTTNNRERERERESSLMWQVSNSETHKFDFLTKNVTVFIFKKMKTPKNCIHFCIQILFFFFLNTENEKWKMKNENWIQIQNQTSFLVVGPTKN